jgi:hypothetical protein
VERRRLGARHAVKEDLCKIRLDVRAAKILARREQVIAGHSEHESRFDDRHGADRPRGQFAAVIQALQRRQDRLHARSIEKGGDPERIQHGDRARHRRAVHLGREMSRTGKRPLDDARRGLDHQPGERTAGQVAADLAIDWVGGIRLDAGDAQGFRAGPAVVIAVVTQQDGMTEARDIEHGGGFVAIPQIADAVRKAASEAAAGAWIVGGQFGYGCRRFRASPSARRDRRPSSQAP